MCTSCILASRDQRQDITEENHMTDKIIIYGTDT